MGKIKITFFLFCLSIPWIVFGAPSISGVSGSLSHGQNITISGADFGSKSQATPVVWDDCSGVNILDKWSGAWPVSNDQPLSTPHYTVPINGIATAHANVNKYLVGRAYDDGSGEGYPSDVMVWKNRNLEDFPFYSYISWYQRVDPLSDFGDNFKWFDYSTRNSPYTMNSSDDSNWYLEYVGGLGNDFHINDDGGSIWNIGPDWTIDYLGNSKYFGNSFDIDNQWVKIELVIKYTDQNDGWFDVYENGVHKKIGLAPHSYNGPTDKYSNLYNRNEAIGGYSRNTGLNNWRYFNDIYLDYTQSRVILGNSNTLSGSTIREPQPPTNWDSDSITVILNQGLISDNCTAYIYVVDANGEVNSSGFPIIVNSSDSIAPSSPSGLIIF